MFIEVKSMDNEQYKKTEIEKDRNELVVKSNDIIRSVRYSLTATEQKLIIYTISRIFAEDKDLKKIRFRISDYINLVGITSNGKEYQRIKTTIRNYAIKNFSYQATFGKVISYLDKEINFSEKK